jgi:hypothetical protein
MKDGPNFCRKGVREDICFSSMLIPEKILNEFIVYGHVLDKKLLWFLQMRLHIGVTSPAKSGL